MKAKHVNESLGFEEDMNPYKNLKIGKYNILDLKDGDILVSKTNIWGHYPDGNMSVHGRNGEWETTASRDDIPMGLRQPYHLVIAKGERLERLQSSFTNVGWRNLRADYRYGFYDWFLEHSYFFEKYIK